MTAAALASVYAERVDRLALLSTAIRFPKEAIDWLWDNVPNLSHPLDPNSDFMLAWFSNPTPVQDDFLTRDRAERASVTAPVWLGVLKAVTVLDWSQLAVRITPQRSSCGPIRMRYSMLQARSA